MNNGIEIKRLIFVFLITSLCIDLFAQKVDDCGKDDNNTLTGAEAIFLQNYIKASPERFDFKDKKILFVTGSSGKTIGSKSAYFDSVKNHLNEHGAKIATELIVLTEEEKLEYEYDAILTYWVKVSLYRKTILDKAVRQTNDAKKMN